MLGDRGGFMAGMMQTASSWDCTRCVHAATGAGSIQLFVVGACHPASGVDGDAAAWMVFPGLWDFGPRLKLRGQVTSQPSLPPVHHNLWELIEE